MEYKDKNFVSAVVYVRNSCNYIDAFLTTLVKVLEDSFESSEIICVNDASKDGSADAIRNFSSKVSTCAISLVNMSYFHGLEVAMNAGMNLAIGDFVFEFDNCYLDYEQDQIMKVYNHALTGFDIVSAVPNRKEKFTSRFFYRVFDRNTDLPQQMHTESFRVLSRRAINRVSSMNKTIPYRKVLYAKQGLSTDYLSYDPIAIEFPQIDKQQRKYRSALATDSLILFTQVGYKFSTIMTFLMMLISLIVIVYTIVVFATADPAAGWTTTILFLSIAFFALFGILSIIIKYLQIIVNLVFKRKNYSFESIEKLTK